MTHLFYRIVQYSASIIETRYSLYQKAHHFIFAKCAHSLAFYILIYKLVSANFQYISPRHCFNDTVLCTTISSAGRQFVTIESRFLMTLSQFEVAPRKLSYNADAAD